MTMTQPHRIPNPAPTPAPPVGSTCPVCHRPDSLRATRTQGGRWYRCRFAEVGECSFEGVERLFRRAPVERMTAAFAERLARIAERVVDDCEITGEATARVDPGLVTALRSAVRRAARDRGLQVRTTHVGDGRVEVRVS
jgi:hypothetical protein